MSLVFNVAPGRRLIFTDAALAKMRAHAQRSASQREAGGVLLGRHLIDSLDVVVDDVSVPQQNDRQTRFSFFRSKQHNVVANERWAATMGRTAYLGLWHTHPELDPTPSCVDRRDWSKAIARDTFEGDRLFFPIVGIQTIRVWTKTRSGPIEEVELQGGHGG